MKKFIYLVTQLAPYLARRGWLQHIIYCASLLAKVDHLGFVENLVSHVFRSGLGQGRRLFGLVSFFLIQLCVLHSSDFKDWPLEKKIGQLFVVPVSPTQGKEHLEKVAQLIEKRHIGGVIFMAGNSEDQIRALEYLQGYAQDPLFTCQDAEWGLGMRLVDLPPLPKNLTLGAIEDLELLRVFGREVARQCRALGVSCNLAPVADVNSNPKNPVIGMRSFGDDPGKVSQRCLAVMEGMQQGGILTCAKHFPGHGDTYIDSHWSLPCIDKSRAEIEKVELLPFRALIEKGVDLVMVGHLYYPALCSFPSSLSYEVMTKLLRESLHFEGVIITDALNMRALSLSYSPEEVAEKALFAGVDFLITAAGDPIVIDQLITQVIPQVMDYIIQTIPEKLIDEKLERIFALRKKHLPPFPEPLPDLCKTLFRHAITRVGEEISLKGPIALVQNKPDMDFVNLLKKYADVDCFSYEEMDEASRYSSLIIQVGPKDSPSKIPKHALIVLFDTPYRIPELHHPHILVGYENVFPAKEMMAEIALGKIPALGKLPVHVYTNQ